MKLQDTMSKLGAKKVAALVSSALVLGALGLAATAGAQDEAPAAPNADKIPGVCPRAEGEAKVGDRPERRGPEGERQARRRGGDEPFARPDRPRPSRAEYADGRDSFGPRPRGEFGRGPEGYGPPRHRDGGERGFRQGPPQRGPQGEGPEGFGAPGRRGGPNRAGVEGPRGPMGPPSFGDMDANGDGAISKEEFDTFHETQRPNRPPRMREGRRPVPPAPGGAPIAPPAPQAPEVAPETPAE